MGSLESAHPAGPAHGLGPEGRCRHPDVLPDRPQGVSRAGEWAHTSGEHGRPLRNPGDLMR